MREKRKKLWIHPGNSGLDDRVPRDVAAYGAPGGMDAARGADDLKEMSREIQARLQADHPTPSYIRSCTGTGTAVGPPARRQQAYKN